MSDLFEKRQQQEFFQLPEREDYRLRDAQINPVFKLPENSEGYRPSVKHGISDDEFTSLMKGWKEDIKEKTEFRNKVTENSGIEFSSLEYDTLNKMRKKGILGDDDIYKLAFSKVLGNYLGLTTASVFRNYDEMWQLVSEDMENRYALPKSRYEAIRDSVQIAQNMNPMGLMGIELQNLHNSMRYADDSEKQALQEKADELWKKINVLKSANDELGKRMPKDALTTIITSTIQSAPMTGKSVAGGIAGGLVTGGIGAAVGAGAGGVGAGPGFAAGWGVGYNVGSFLTSTAEMTGLLYVDLLAAGVEQENASRLALVGGSINGFIESGLGIVAGWGKSAGKAIGGAVLSKELQAKIAEAASKSFIKRISTSVASSSVGKNIITRTVFDIAKQAGEEGLEEGLQFLVEQAMYSLGDAMQNAPVNRDLWGSPAFMSEMKQSIIGGIAGGLGFGIAGLPLTITGNVVDTARQTKQLKNLAAAIDNEVEFRELAKKIPLAEKLSDGEIKEIYDSQENERRAYQEEARLASELGETAGGEGYAEKKTDSETGEVIPLKNSKTGEAIPFGEVYHKKNGLLFTELDEKRGIFKIGDPRVEGKKNLYAHFEYKIDDDGTVRINKFRVRTDLDTAEFRREAFDRFAEAFAGHEIAWDAKTNREVEIREELIKSNPYGTGLNYYPEKINIADEIVDTAAKGDTAETARAKMRFGEQMAKHLPGSTEASRSGAVRLIDRIGRAYGLTFDKFIEKLSLDPNEIFTDKAGTAVEAENKKAAQEGLQGVKGALQPMMKKLDADMKSVLYSVVYLDPKKADFSTVIHELKHAVDNFLEKHDPGLFNRMMDAAGKYDPGIHGEDEYKWRRERSAYAFERYLETGEAPTPELKSLFQQLKEWLRDIIEHLAGMRKLTPEQKEVFDELLSKADKVSAELDSAGQQHEAASGNTAASSQTAQADSLQNVNLDSVGQQREASEKTGETKENVDETEEKTGETLEKTERTSEKSEETKGKKSEKKQEKSDVDDSGVSAIRERYEAAKKVYGDTDTINVNGEEIEGRWVITEAQTPTASHDETTFNETEGFLKVDGKTINDRDYKRDRAAQEAVLSMASNYDSRALEGVVVSSDGIVISGNNRTMSGKIAAKNDTDGKYLTALKNKAKRYGFTEGQIQKFEHPRLLFEVDVKGQYDTALFAQFNRSTTKAIDPVETAVKMAKLIKAPTVKSISEAIAQHESIDELYQDRKALQEIFNTLKTDKLIGEYDMPQYYTEQGGITGAGEDLLENVLLGATLKEDNIRVLSDIKGLRRKLARALPYLIENKAMGDYSVISEVNEAVRIAAEVEKNSKKWHNVEEWAAQSDFDFLEQKNQIAVELAKQLVGKNQSGFADMMGGLNAVLSDAASGQADLLASGVESKENIVRRYLGIKAEIESIRQANNKIINNEKAPIVERNAAAMDNAGLAKLESDGPTMFQLAVHASPYIFDEFNNSFIGSGLSKLDMGSLHHGWGHYLYGRKEAAEWFNKAISKVKGVEGQLYEVDIPGDEKLLLWEKPISEQSAEIQQAADKLITWNKNGVSEFNQAYSIKKFNDGSYGFLRSIDGKAKWATAEEAQAAAKEEIKKTLTGKDFYTTLSKSIGARETSLLLDHLGVKGTKYFDKSTEKIGVQRDFNYVIFGDSDINITRTFLQTAYHGSPFRFDRFNISNVGKGDGHKFYGWGHYFAGKREIAEWYRKELGYTKINSPEFSVDGEKIDNGDIYYHREVFSLYKYAADDRLNDYVKIAEKALEDAKQDDDYNETRLWQGILNTAHELKGKKVEQISGQLYEVDIPGDEEMLDWDRSFRQQPAFIQELLKDKFKNITMLTGGEIYQRLAGIKGSDKAVSKWLNENGVKGVRHMDNTSLLTGENSHNYVIFDDNEININRTFFQIIGEQGARAMDRKEESNIRIDNLNIARQMEEAGKDAKNIRMATGWERGADKKWRYEIPDIGYKTNERFLEGKAVYLQDIVNAVELFTAYPELEKYTIQKVTTDLYNASFNPETKGININESLVYNGLKLVSAITHELQHAIQHIEGFAQGSNTSFLGERIGRFGWIGRHDGQLRQLRKENENIFDTLTDEEKDIYKEYNWRLESNRREGRNSDNLELFYEISAELKEKSFSIDKFQKYFINNQEYLYLSKNNSMLTPGELYTRTAGEVEARNTQTRLNLTAEERKETLLAETEDVAREDQFFIENGNLAESAGQTFFQLDNSEKSDIITDEELEEIGVAYGSKEKYRQAIKDVVGRLVPGRLRGTQPRRILLGQSSSLEKGKSLLAESELQKVKRINIVGKQINSREQAAALFSAFRDPRVEIFNILYTSETGEVLAHTAWTSGVPYLAKGFDGKADEAIERMRKTMEGVNAKNIWIAHNHPSGTSTPSINDIELTGKYQEEFGKQFAGHIVLDHDNYNFIIDGKTSQYDLKPKGKNFISPAAKTQGAVRMHGIAETFKNVLAEENDVDVLAVLDRGNRIISWNYLNNQLNVTKNTIYDYMRVMGGTSVIILSNNDTGFFHYKDMAARNQIGDKSVFLDVISVDKKTGYATSDADFHEYNWGESFVERHGTMRLVDNKTEQPVFFQLDDEMIDDASRYDTWEEFRDSVEPAETSDADNAWYKSIWEDSKKIHKDTLFQDDEEKGRGKELDERFYKEADEKYLTSALKELIRVHEDQTLEPAKEEGDAANEEYRRIKRLQKRIDTELPNAGSVIGMAAQVRSGRRLSSTQYSRLKSFIRKNMRDYRSVFADIMGQEEYLEELAETKDGEPSARLADPRPEKQDTKARLKEIASIIKDTDPELAKGIEDGSVSYEDPRIKAFIKGVETEYKEAREAIEKLEKETAQDYARLANNAQRRIVNAHEKMIKAREAMEAVDEVAARRMKEEGKIAEPYLKKQKLEKASFDQALKAYNDLVNIYGLDAQAREAIARQEAVSKERARLREIMMRQRAARALRETKKKLVKRITRNVSFDNVACDQATLAKTIQRIFINMSYHGINKWIGPEDRKVLREVWSQWSTDEEFRENLLEQVKNRNNKTAFAQAEQIERILNKEWKEIGVNEKRTLYRLLPGTDAGRDLKLRELDKQNRESVQLDIDEQYVEGKGVVLVLGEDLKRRVKEAIGDELYNRMQNKPFTEWSLAEAEELGREIDKLIVEGKTREAARKEARRSLDERYRAQVLEALENTGIVINDDDTPEEKEKKRTEKNRVLKKFTRGKKNNLFNNFFDANLRRFTTALDGGRKGIFTNLLYWGENDAYNEEQRQTAARRLLVDTVMEKNHITLDELYREVEITGLENELGNSDIDLYRHGGKVTVDDLLYMMRGYENEQTRQAIMYGNLSNARERNHSSTSDKALEGFTITAHGKMMAVMSYAREFFAKEENKKFLKLYDAIGEDYDRNGERLNRACIDMFNKPMWRVDKYVPMNRLEVTGEENENRVIEDLLGTTGVGDKWVDRGFTKEREKIKPSGQRPIELGLYKTWAKSVSATEHLLAYGPLVQRLNAVFKGYHAGEVKQALRDRWGQAAVNRVEDTIAEFANPDALMKTANRSDVNKIVRMLRGKTATAYLAWKTSGILKQLATSPWPYLQEIPPAQYLAACVEVAGGAGKINDFIREKSIYMKNRDFDPMVKLIREARENNENVTQAKIDKFNAVGMKGLEWVDWICVAPGWLAKYRSELANVAKETETKYQELLKKYQGKEYADVLPTQESKVNRALSEVMSEERQDAEAVARADDAVRRMQPSSRITDIAPLFKGKTEAWQILLQFQTALNVIWQNVRYDLPLAVKEKQVGTIVGMVTGYVLAGICMGMLTEGFDDDDDDEKKKAMKILFYSFTQFTDAVPIIGDGFTKLAEHLITGKTKYTGQQSVLPAIEKAFGGIGNAAGAFREDDPDKRRQRYEKAAENMAEAAGLYFGLPVSGAKELGRVAGVGDGDGEFNLYLQALTGRKNKH